MRIGTPVLHAWMPSVLVSSSTSMSSSAVAPSASAFRMCSRQPGAYMCVAAASMASRISCLTFGSSGP